MKKETIYLQDIELARKMHKGGWNKETYFSMLLSYHEPPIFFETKDAAKNLTTLHQDSISEVYYAPTLGEIDLPVCVSINKYVDIERYGMYYYRVSFAQYEFSIPNEETNFFISELEARAHAWLWAKQNEKEAQNA